MKKTLTAMAVLMAASIVCTHAQTGDDYRRQYDEYSRTARQKYDNFRQKCNDDYARFVEQAWQSFSSRPALKLPDEDKPVPPRPYDIRNDSIDRRTPVELPHDEVVPAPVPQPQPAPVEPVKEQPAPETVPFTFTYCGTTMSVRLSDAHRFTLTDCSESSVAKAWSRCSQPDFDNVLRDCLALRLAYGLCDWAYLQMLRCMSEAFMGTGTDEATLLAAYIYCQSGYRMRLGRSAGSRLCMLAASRHKIYGRPYFVVDGENFYPIGSGERNLEICGAAFPKEQSLSLYMTSAPLLAMNATPPRTLQSERYADMRATVSVNRNLLDFYSGYPASEISGNFMTRWAMYANTAMDNAVRDSLYPALRRAIDGLPAKEAAECLLNFVQTAIVYGYDETVWGADRAFFSEETLFYPYCDCEDRSILFSRLVRDLLGLPVVLVYYPGHLASAVCFGDDNTTGDYIRLGNRSFVICDPTYIGAGIGVTMPGMDNTAAKVILLE